MKRILITIITLFILSACGQAQEEVTEKANSTTDTNTKDSTSENLMVDDVDLETEEETEPYIVKGFTPFEEINDFVIDSSIWESGNIRHIVKAEDETLYYFNDTNGSKETGFMYEVFTLDNNNNAVIESEIYSPTSNKLTEEGETFYVRKQLIDNILIMQYEHHEDYNNFTKQITIETLDIGDILTSDTTEYEAEVVMNETIENIEDVQFNDIVSTSKGPVFVYQENLESGSGFLIHPLNNHDEIGEDLVLNDPYDIGFDTTIKFIDFEQGYYYLYDYGDDGLKRLEIESGEPLYDGADDKVLPLDDHSFDQIIPINDTSFYIIHDYNYTIYVVSSDLDLIDSTSIFASEYEMDDYDGYISGPYYLGDNEFFIMDEYEYQRKERLKFSISEYVF